MPIPTAVFTELCPFIILNLEIMSALSLKMVNYFFIKLGTNINHYQTMSRDHESELYDIFMILCTNIKHYQTICREPSLHCLHNSICLYF